MRFVGSVKVVAAASAAACLALGASSVSAETTLTSVMGLPVNLELAQSYLVNFKDAVNTAGKGVVQINFIGGPEVVPPNKAADAVRRGQFDVLHSPTAYYIGLVPEGYALTLATVSAKTLRANGGWAILQQAYAEKANAKLLAWGESGTQYNTYLTKAPEFEANGNLSLKSFRMRVTGTYRPLFTALGANTVGMKASEIYTGLQRGVVQGFGWPEVGIVALGLHKLVKYRIDPPFYRSNNAVTINMDKWRKLSTAEQNFLLKESLAYEQRAVEYMKSRQQRDEKAVFESGAKRVTLSPSAAKHYLNAANVAVWNRLKKQSKYAAQLQQKAFPDWTPPAN